MAKQPASEQLQKWILFALGIIITALGAQNVQMMNITRELASLTSTVAALVKEVDGNKDRILRLENYHFSNEPRREPKLIPPNEVIQGDRRKIHLEDK